MQGTGYVTCGACSGAGSSSRAPATAAASNGSGAAQVSCLPVKSAGARLCSVQAEICARSHVLKPYREHLCSKSLDATFCICVEGSKPLISQAGSSSLSQGAERCGSCSGTGKVMCIACLCTGKSLPEGFSHAIPQALELLSSLRGCHCPCQAKTACHLQGRRLPGSMTFGSILSSENGMRKPRIPLHLHYGDSSAASRLCAATCIPFACSSCKPPHLMLKHCVLRTALTSERSDLPQTHEQQYCYHTVTGIDG